MLSEILDNQIDCYDQSIDPDARIGHKTGQFLLFTDTKLIWPWQMNGLSQQQQSHPAKHLMVRNLQYWFKKSKAAGATVNEVIADTAYSTLENLKDAQSNEL